MQGLRLSLACCTLPVVLLVLLLHGDGASAKDPCSKDWLRFMVVNACGMDKRHLERKKPMAAPALREILNEVDEELDNWLLREGLDEDKEGQGQFRGGGSKSASSAPWRPHIPSDATKRDKKKTAPSDGQVAGASRKKGFFTRLFEHPGQVLAEAWLGLTGGEPKRAPRRRAIQNMISRCCSEDCSEDAFEGVCD